jgi:TPP-dependent pyruvate/acetoin dehydrogenase alpha subunit
VPVLFVCENNLYAMGTAIQYEHAVTDIARKAACFDLPSAAVDGMDVLAVEAAAREAVEAVRADGGPRFLECHTYRFRAHSMYDAQLYRSKDEVKQWEKRCPIATFIKKMKRRGLVADAEVQAIEAEVAREIAEAVAFAEAGSWEPVEDATRFVYSEGRMP